MISKRLAALAIVLVAWLALPAGSSAHTLSIAKAKAAAKKFLDQDNKFYPYDAPKQLTSCKRKSAHTVDCGYRAVNDSGSAECGSVRVRLKSRKSKRPSVKYKADPYMCAAG